MRPEAAHPGRRRAMDVLFITTSELSPGDAVYSTVRAMPTVW